MIGSCFGVEDLHAFVARVDHRQIPFGQTAAVVADREFRRFFEFAFPRAGFADRREPRARFVEHLDVVVLPVGDIDFAGHLVDRETLRFRERVFRAAVEARGEGMAFHGQGRGGRHGQRGERGEQGQARAMRQRATQTPAGDDRDVSDAGAHVVDPAPG